MKIKENGKSDNYFYLARELKKSGSIRVVVIPVIISLVRTFPKSLERGQKELKIGERVKSIQTTALFRSAKIMRRVLET